MGHTARLDLARLGLVATMILLGAGLVILGLGGPVHAAPTGLQANAASRLSSQAWVEAAAIPTGTAVYTGYVYLPFVSSAADVCRPIEGASYGSLSVADWQSAERPAEEHGDINLALRGYTPTTAFLGLIDIGGPTDDKAPQLAGLFAPARLPNFTAVYQVYNWEWGCNCRGDPIDDWEVTLIDMAAAPGEAIHVPDSGYQISPDYEVLVLYASAERLTLKYTSQDTIVGGYGIHVENICIDPNLVALYQQLNSEGRHSLPALRAGQAFGRARSDHVGVAVRDDGAFLEPRSRKDWWHGY